MSSEPLNPLTGLVGASRYLHEAQLAYQDADARFREAARVRADALEKLSEAQTNFDASAAKLRHSAPSGSDWRKV